MHKAYGANPADFVAVSGFAFGGGGMDGCAGIFVIIYSITTRLFQSGSFVEDEWTIASKKTDRVRKMGAGEVILGILLGVSGFERYENRLFDILIADHFSCGGKKFFTSNEKPSSVACECCSTAPTAATRHE